VISVTAALTGPVHYPGMGIPSLHYLFSTSMFKYLVFNDQAWDYSKYDFSDFLKETKYASAYLDATQTDYTEFKKLNRKMIMFHGWNDPALSAFSTISRWPRFCLCEGKFRSQRIHDPENRTDF